MRIQSNSKFTLELPKNENELNELISYHKQFTAKYYSIEPTSKSFQRFRDYVCESLLGMTNGGYQQLLSIWKSEESRLKGEQEIIESLSEAVSELPDSLYLWFPTDESPMLCTKPDAVKMNKFGVSFDADDFEEIQGDLELAILNAFEGESLLVAYPRADRYGTPKLACDELASDLVTDLYGVIPGDNFNVMSHDHGCDNVETVIIKLVRTNG